MSFSLGAYVAARRKSLGLVQQDLATSLGYTVQAISSFEGGESQISLSLMPSLANLLEISLDDLFLEKEDAPRVKNANKPFDGSLLAQNLVSLRIKKNLSQEKEAEALGVSKRSIVNYENGSTTPSLESVQRLMTLYGIKPSSLFYGAPEPSPRKVWPLWLKIALPIIAIAAIVSAIVFPLSLRNKAAAKDDSLSATSAETETSVTTTTTSQETSSVASTTGESSGESSSKSVETADSSSSTDDSSLSTAASSSSTDASSSSTSASSSSSSSSTEKPDLDPNFPGLKTLRFNVNTDGILAGKDTPRPVLVEPAGYFNDGNATLTYSINKNLLDVYWIEDDSLKPEDTHYLHVGSHTSEMTQFLMVLTATRNGHTYVHEAGVGNGISNPNNPDQDLDTENYPGLTHYYFAGADGSTDITAAPGDSFAIHPVFETYLAAFPKDYASTTAYFHLCEFTNNVVSLTFDDAATVFTATVNSAAVTGDTCYGTALICHVLYNHSLHGDLYKLKITVK